MRFIGAIKRSPLVCWFYDKRRLLIFVLKKTDYTPTAPSDGVSFNGYGDVLNFDACEPWHDSKSIVRDFCSRLDRGEVMAAINDEGVLASYGWLNPNQSSAYFPLVKQEFTFPAKSSAIYNVYTHIGYRGKGYYKRVLNGIVEWCFKNTDSQHVVTAIEESNKVAIKANLQMGFREVACLSYVRKLGRVQSENRE